MFMSGLYIATICTTFQRLVKDNKLRTIQCSIATCPLMSLVWPSEAGTEALLSLYLTPGLRGPSSYPPESWGANGQLRLSRAFCLFIKLLA